MTQRLLELLNIEYPIVLGGMAWLGTPALAASVSNSGGLGTLGIGNMPVEQARCQIRELKELTSKPFAVNLVMFNPHIQELIDLLIEEEVPVAILAAGNPGKYIEQLKTQGITVLAVVSTDVLARRLERSKVDAIIGEGLEAGGHVGDVTTLSLIPRLTAVLKVPVIAAGGIGSQGTAAACIAMGAQGVQMGTRFIATEECEAHPRYKELIVRSGLRDTMITGEALGHPVRVLKTPFARSIYKMERESREEAESMLIGSLEKAFREGDLEQGSFMAGQSVAQIQSIASVQEVLEDIHKGISRDKRSELL